MNSALLLAQGLLLLALVPSIYLANYYYKAYYNEVKRGRTINTMLVWDKYFLVDELQQLRAKLDATAKDTGNPAHRDVLRIVTSKLDLVLDGDKRRLNEAKRRST